MFKHIIVALDGSDHARKAAEVAGDLAALYGARMTLVHVRSAGPVSPEVKRLVEVEHLLRSEEPRAQGTLFPQEMLTFMHDAQSNAELTRALGALGRQMLDSMAVTLAEKGVSEVSTELLDGNPADGILALAKRERADLIALGSRGLGDLKGLLLGSVSHRVSQLAECTCLTVK
jgi:nucleotide-binding universal stress UspA family protein